MKKLIIKSGQPIKFIGTLPTEPIILKAGMSKANPSPKFIILKGTKL